MQGINFTNSDKTSYTFQLESTMKSYLKSAEKRKVFNYANQIVVAEMWYFDLQKTQSQRFQGLLS